MKLRADQLAAHLSKPLAPVYFVCGDEPLQATEACDAIRAAARRQGYTDRIVFNIGAGFDWDAFRAEANALSLFAARRVLEVRTPAGKFDKTGGAALEEYCENPPPDTVLLASAGKLEREAQKSAWFHALESAGVVIQVWPVNVAQFPAWVERRMRAKGLQPSAEAVELLAGRTEGNLLAATQEIEKLLMLHGPGPLGTEQVMHAVSDSARFDVFGLGDAVLQGDTVRAVRIVNGLRGEGEEPVLVLWALAREVRTLTALAHARRSGEPSEAIYRKNNVWDARRPGYEKALPRHTLPRWQRLLQRCAQVDRVIKGRAPGNPWDELLELAALASGTVVFDKRRVGAR